LIVLKNTNQQQKPIYGQQRTNHVKEMLMIAAHGWDLAGASHAGLATWPVKGSPYTLSST
jgi:hypothetical protein